VCEACEEVNRIEARGRKYDPFMKVNALPICSFALASHPQPDPYGNHLTWKGRDKVKTEGLCLVHFEMDQAVIRPLTKISPLLTPFPPYSVRE